MQSKATTPDAYIAELPADRKEAMTKLRKEVLKNLPKGFKETMGYGMMGYVVPHSLSGRLSLQTYRSIAVCRFRQSEEFYCILSHGDLF